jgi:hypothetical protein
VTIQSAGSFVKHGAYRLAVVLYEGFQPVAAGPGGAPLRAATGRRTLGAPPAGGGASEGPAAAQGGGGGAVAAAAGVVRWGEALTLRGLRLRATSLLVFQLHLAKPGVAGLPAREALVAWGFAPVLAKGQVGCQVGEREVWQECGARWEGSRWASSAVGAPRPHRPCLRLPRPGAAGRSQRAAVPAAAAAGRGPQVQLRRGRHAGLPGDPLRRDCRWAGGGLGAQIEGVPANPWEFRAPGVAAVGVAAGALQTASRPHSTTLVR